MKTLVLASASPRRLELLREAGHHVVVHPSHVSEKIEKNLIPDQLVLHLAELKARSAAKTLAENLQREILIGADTEVFFQDQRLGKPSSLEEAVETLMRLSGKAHEVKTGVCLFHPPTGQMRTFVESTRVEMGDLQRAQVEEYVRNFQPLDKAGSYGIQEVPKEFITRQEGSRSNVIGLPMEALEKNLVQFRWEILKLSIPPSCRLLAVSKKQSIEKIRWAYEMGQRDFAENYVQEALTKIKELEALDIRWHFIGNLQKNKVKQVIGKCALIHSVDSFELLEKIQKQATELNVVQKVYLQVNLAEESSKQGFSEVQLRSLLDKSGPLSHVEICGLMTFPPLQEAEKNRIHFRHLRQLRDELQQKYPSILGLSMGTSEDFEVAVQEGSTDVRLGSVLFGERAR